MGSQRHCVLGNPLGADTPSQTEILQPSNSAALSTADLRTFAPLTWNKPLISITEEYSHQELVSLDTEITGNLRYIMKLYACHVRNLFESYFGFLASVLSRTKHGKAVSEEIN